MKRIVLILVIAGLWVAGCASSEPETPGQAVQAIIELYEARDFDSLIRTRYAEISKARDEQQIQTLIDRFGTRYKEEAALNQAVATYRSVLRLTPELSENGTVAVFKLNDGFIKLSRMDNGNWGFHL